MNENKTGKSQSEDFENELNLMISKNSELEKKIGDLGSKNC